MSLSVGLSTFALWRWTGNDAWINEFWHGPGLVVQASLAAIQLWLSVWSFQEFEPGQPMRTAWLLISGSAACDVAKIVSTKVFAAESAVRDAGLFLGGTCRFVLLAAGLWLALRAYRESQMLARLRAIDWVLLALAVSYVLWEAWSLAAALSRGKHPGILEELSWPVDPLLCLLLAQALLLFRSVQRMGPGLIALCWRAFSIGVGLICLGDMLFETGAYGYVPWPWNALEWYVWLPAAGAFALAPAYQLEAIQKARSLRRSMPSLKSRPN